MKERESTGGFRGAESWRHRQASWSLQLQDKDQKQNIVEDVLQQLPQQWLLCCGAEENNWLHSPGVLAASRDTLIRHRFYIKNKHFNTIFVCLWKYIEGFTLGLLLMWSDPIKVKWRLWSSVTSAKHLQGSSKPSFSASEQVLILEPWDFSSKKIDGNSFP